MRIVGKALFDESGDEELPGYFGVAGFAGSDDQWKAFDELWAVALKATDAPYLHMREFAHSVDAFRGWKGDKDRRERLMSGVVRAILETGLTSVGSAIARRTSIAYRPGIVSG